MNSMQGYSHKKPNLAKYLIALIQRIRPQILKNQPRPPELPPAAPDCGWNHGEQKEK